MAKIDKAWIDKMSLGWRVPCLRADLGQVSCKMKFKAGDKS